MTAQLHVQFIFYVVCLVHIITLKTFYALKVSCMHTKHVFKWANHLFILHIIDVLCNAVTGPMWTKQTYLSS